VTEKRPSEQEPRGEDRPLEYILDPVRRSAMKAFLELRRHENAMENEDEAG